MHKLLFIIGGLNPAGGEERSISILCNELIRHEIYEITIACLDGGHAVYPLDGRINVIYLLEHAKSRPARFMHLAKLIKQSDYDLIIGYGFSARIPAGIIGRLPRVPVVFCERRNPKYKEDSAGMNLRCKIGHFLVNNKRFCAVFQSSAVMDLYTKIKRKTVIPNMLDVSAMHDVNDWGVRKNAVINASRYVAFKNQRLLIKAFSSLCPPGNHYVLDIYGKGELEAYLKKETEKENARGYININPDNPDIYNVMNNAKIYVCSSNTEGYPNSLLEAMAMGMACVSTDCCGAVRELIEDGVTGLIVPAGDEKAMAAAIKKLIENDDFAKKIASRAVYVREANAKDKIIGRWIEFINSLIMPDA